MTATETSVAEVTVTVPVVADKPLEIAVNCTEPAATPVARPVAEILATPGAELLQAAVEVRFCVVPSEKVPVRVNCWLAPFAKLAPLGLIETEANVALPTTSVARPATEPEVACRVAVPGAIAVASPVLLTLASARFEELHVTAVERFAVLPSE